NISFNQTIDSGGQLSLNGGTAGVVTVTGAIGATTPVAQVNVPGAASASLGNIGVALTAGVSGTTSVNTTAAAGITYTGTIYHTTGSQSWNAGAANPIKLNNAATIFTTAASAVAFTGLVNMNAFNLSVDTTNATGSPAGNNISFNQTIDSGGQLSLNGGTAGVVTVTGAIGATTPVAQVNVPGAASASLGNIGVALTAGVSGTTSVNTTAAAGITYTGTIYHTTGSQSWNAG